MVRHELDAILGEEWVNAPRHLQPYESEDERIRRRTEGFSAGQRAAFAHWWSTWAVGQADESRWPLAFWDLVARALMDSRLLIPNNFLIPLGDLEPGSVGYDLAMELLVSRNNYGIEREKAGDLASAVYVYETSVADHFFGTHPYDRLRIIYTRNGWYDEAVRICNVYLDLPDRPQGQTKPHFEHFRDKLQRKASK